MRHGSASPGPETAAGTAACYRVFSVVLEMNGILWRKAVSGDHLRVYFLHIWRVWRTNLRAGRRFNRPLCSFVSVCFHTPAAKFLVLLLRGHRERWPLFIPAIKTSVFQANLSPDCLCVNEYIRFSFVSVKLLLKNPFCLRGKLRECWSHVCLTARNVSLGHKNAMWANRN